MLQGTNDKAVPSEYGDRHWEALWTPRILEWLDRETEVISAETLPAGAPMIAEP